MKRLVPLCCAFATLFLLSACSESTTTLDCQPDSLQCGNSCVLLESDKNHCGSCNQACPPNQRCVEGQCREVHCEEESHLYAACFLTGQVAALSTCTQSRVAMELVGDKPQALSGMGEVLLCADDGAEQLLRLDAQTLKPVGEAPGIGQTPIHVSVYGSHAYVVNAGSNTLQVLNAQTWQTLAELPFGANTSPQAFALVGHHGFVPLYGNLGTGETSAGQRLVRVNLENPAAPFLEGEANFTGLDLQSPDTFPLPYDVVHHQGALYVALNNLSRTFQAGPGVIAKVPAQNLSNTSLLFVGGDCTNVTSLASNGPLLAASCAGDWGMTPGAAGVALFADDEVKSWWAAPSGFSPGAMAFQGDTLWVANGNGGDVFLLSTEGQTLRLRRGEGGSEGGPIQTCPQGPAGYTVVQSLWLKP
jgi:hypothetical protein